MLKSLTSKKQNRGGTVVSTKSPEPTVKSPLLLKKAFNWDDSEGNEDSKLDTSRGYLDILAKQESFPVGSRPLEKSSKSSFSSSGSSSRKTSKDIEESDNKMQQLEFKNLKKSKAPA